ncbi:unnamed protein product [Eruca vesicaria subsp. sativa]|uniref:F-box associated beta-propeller type 1 domain-containing protein n=1 Tax=Eruca vesicaria subsp. sativa TaxID=29727 RepID=A0ABC8L546_ERUVS|nr:unnamed protein product [Eruca vesicaria subsp. sativa]
MFSLEMKIWMSNKIGTKKVSWDEFLVVNLGDFMIGDLVNVVSFVLDVDNRVAVCCSIGKDDSKEECTSIFIIGKNIYRHVYGEGIIDGSWPHLMNYVPSSVHILKKSTRKGKRKRITRRYEPDVISARSVKETNVTHIAKAKRVPKFALNVPKRSSKRK